MSAQVQFNQVLAGKSKTIVKILGVVLLVLLLLIPLSMIKGVLTERMLRRNEAVGQITSTWGKEQVIVGPVLIIPYKNYYTVFKEEIINGKMEKREVKESRTANAYFLPETQSIESQIEPSILHRGIYNAIVYTAEIKISGRFLKPDFDKLKILPQDVMWSDAVVAFAVTDLRGVQDVIYLKWGENRFPLTPGSKLKDFTSGLESGIIGLNPEETVWQFETTFSLNGSDAISFAPVGMKNTVYMSSPWADPSFQGAFLPLERNVTAKGFKAKWQISYYGRSFPQQWTDLDSPLPFSATNIKSSLFGAGFIQPIDSYRNVDRATKYGILFITLVFTAFFLFEVLSPIRVHPFQYTFVGAGLCLFYLALLSLSEFLSFPVSYAVASFICMLLISFYCLKALKGGFRATIIAGELISIYAYLYVILQMQDYSLLFGTVGLFVVLGLVMFFTRNIDWYEKDRN